MRGRQIPYLPNIQAFRLNFTTESANEVETIIQIAKEKLDGTLLDSVFNQENDTRGYYNKETL